MKEISSAIQGFTWGDSKTVQEPIALGCMSVYTNALRDDEGSDGSHPEGHCAS